MELWNQLIGALPFEWASHGFMRSALLAVLVISPLFGLLSTMVVESRMSFFSDALGHSATYPNINKNGAPSRIRTLDPPVMSRLL